MIMRWNLDLLTAPTLDRTNVGLPALGLIYWARSGHKFDYMA